MARFLAAAAEDLVSAERGVHVSRIPDDRVDLAWREPEADGEPRDQVRLQWPPDGVQFVPPDLLAVGRGRTRDFEPAQRNSERVSDILETPAAREDDSRRRLR